SNFSTGSSSLSGWESSSRRGPTFCCSRRRSFCFIYLKRTLCDPLVIMTHLVSMILSPRPSARGQLVAAVLCTHCNESFLPVFYGRHDGTAPRHALRLQTRGAPDVPISCLV